jgi:hypothetical protein
MADIYEWLEKVHQPSYAPTSPGLGPMDQDPVAGRSILQGLSMELIIGFTLPTPIATDNFVSSLGTIAANRKQRQTRKYTIWKHAESKNRGTGIQGRSGNMD